MVGDVSDHPGTWPSSSYLPWVHALWTLTGQAMDGPIPAVQGEFLPIWKEGN